MSAAEEEAGTVDYVTDLSSHPDRPDAPTPLGQIYLPANPGTPVGRFQFLVDPNVGRLVEIGSAVAADTLEGTIVGTVVDMRTVGTESDPVRADLSGSYAPERMSRIPEVMCAEVQVFHSERMRPVKSGHVRAATATEVLEATGHNAMDWPIPCGVVELLSPSKDGVVTDQKFARVCLDGSFLLGPEAQGMMVVGRSGVASKSSFTSVLLRSALANASDQAPHRLAVLSFNVKGEDLLWLDEDPEEPILPEDQDIYDALGLDATPFPDVTVYSPALPGQADVCRSPREDAIALRWDLTMVWRELRHFFPNLYDDEKFSSFVSAFEDLLLRNSNPAVRVDTFDKLETWFENEIEQADTNGNDYCFGGRVHIASMRRIRRMMMGLLSRGHGLFSRGAAHARDDVPTTGWRNGQVIVVDLAGLPAEVQGFVIARTCDRILRAAEAGELGVDSIALVMDELNAFAPSQGGEMATVRKSLQKVATQGRYAGVALFGAAQSASRIDELLRDNCASKAVGNSPDSELTSGVHGRMPTGLVERLATLPKGRMAVYHTAFRQAVVVRFPRPAWKMGKSRTTAGARPTVSGVLRNHMSERSAERLTEGVPDHVVESVLAEAGSVAVAAQRLEALREVDMSQVAVHEKRTFDPDDPFSLD